MRAPAFAVRAAKGAVAVAALATLLQGLRGVGTLPAIARSERAMCEGLPDYAALASSAPAQARVEVRVDPAEERAAERFVCARLALAPRPVEARPDDGATSPAPNSPGIPETPAPDYRLSDRGEGATFERLR